MRLAQLLLQAKQPASARPPAPPTSLVPISPLRYVLPYDLPPRVTRKMQVGWDNCCTTIISTKQITALPFVFCLSSSIVWQMLGHDEDDNSFYCACTLVWLVACTQHSTYLRDLCSVRSVPIASPFPVLPIESSHRSWTVWICVFNLSLPIRGKSNYEGWIA